MTGYTEFEFPNRKAGLLVTFTHSVLGLSMMFLSGTEPTQNHMSMKHQLIYSLSEFPLKRLSGFAEMSGGLTSKSGCADLPYLRGSVKSKSSPSVIP